VVGERAEDSGKKVLEKGGGSGIWSGGRGGMHDEVV